jgi:GT2 family glycosyltransferase
MPKSSIIIPVFNQAALTRQCLDILVTQGVEEIIVVDDGSTDSTPQLLQTFGQKIRILTHSENRGFAAASNDGAAAASGDYLVFLNNDTIPETGWLGALETYADNHPQVSVVGSKLLYPDERVQHVGVAICQDGYPRHLYRNFPANHPAACKSRRYQVVTGASMLVRRKVFEEARGFDPGFRNGFEDVDLCLRLGAKGHEIHCCAESVLHHFESVSPARFKHSGSNVALYRERWLGKVQADDFRYYLEDGLIRFNYENHYPLGLGVSPLLACLESDERRLEVEHRLGELARAMAELSRENTRLSVELGNHDQDSPILRYRELRTRIRETVQAKVPTGSTVLVISKGDSSLLELPERQGWHFPQTDRGAYNGHHPESSGAAIAHLESLRTRGAEYLLIPQPSFWWLDYYTELRQHLETRYTKLDQDASCAVYRLTPGGEVQTNFTPNPADCASNHTPAPLVVDSNPV